MQKVLLLRSMNGAQYRTGQAVNCQVFLNDYHSQLPSPKHSMNDYHNQNT